MPVKPTGQPTLMSAGALRDALAEGPAARRAARILQALAGFAALCFSLFSRLLARRSSMDRPVIRGLAFFDDVFGMATSPDW